MKIQFVANSNGKKSGVLLPIKEYQKLLEKIEELEDIKLYDKAKSRKNSFIPIEEAFAKLDSKRNKKA